MPMCKGAPGSHLVLWSGAQGRTAVAVQPLDFLGVKFTLEQIVVVHSHRVVGAVAAKGHGATDDHHTSISRLHRLMRDVHRNLHTVGTV